MFQFIHGIHFETIVTCARLEQRLPSKGAREAGQDAVGAIVVPI